MLSFLRALNAAAFGLWQSHGKREICLQCNKLQKHQLHHSSALPNSYSPNVEFRPSELYTCLPSFPESIFPQQVATKFTCHILHYSNHITKNEHAAPDSQNGRTPTEVLMPLPYCTELATIENKSILWTSSIQIEPVDLLAAMIEMSKRSFWKISGSRYKTSWSECANTPSLDFPKW